MSRFFKNPCACLFLGLLLLVCSIKLWATDVGYSTGMNPTREMMMKIDRYAGTPMNGLYIGTVAFSSATTGTVTLTGKSGQGASISAKLFSSKNTGTDATYVKSVTMISVGLGLVTMSGSTTGNVNVMAVDVFTDPLTF